MTDKTTKSSKSVVEPWITVISKDRVEGELEPTFAKKYANELKSWVKIVDPIKKVEHMVGYNMNPDMPRFTTGWKELGEFYELSEEHHPVMLAYIGGSKFHIFPIVYPKLYMSEIPDWHTLYGIHDDSIQFDRVIPSLDSQVVKWEMKRSFIQNIRKYGHGFIRAVGPSGKMFTCNVSEVAGEDDCIRVDYGWMEMFMENGFKSGDILRFIPEGFASSNVVKFEKKRREECMLGDAVDFDINPTLHWMYESDSE